MIRSDPLPAGGEGVFFVTACPRGARQVGGATARQGAHDAGGGPTAAQQRALGRLGALLRLKFTYLFMARFLPSKTSGCSNCKHIVIHVTPSTRRVTNRDYDAVRAIATVQDA